MAGAAALLFAATGVGLTRLLLPEGLRSHEWLWVLPVGACATPLSLTVLGFAGVPLEASLVVVLVGGSAFSAWALLRTRTGAAPAERRSGAERPGFLAGVAWPAYLALLLVLVALTPLFHLKFLSVMGQGADAHLAVGTADFLQDNYPTSVAPEEPTDRMPLVWRSKYPIYYGFGAVSQLSGFEPYQSLTAMTAVLLGLAALGWFLVARHLLGTGVAAAGAAMGVAGLDRIVLFTGLHPYFNQTWGYFTLPFSIVLAWWAVAHRSRGGLVLLALFMALGAFAYPLALPIPAAALGVAWWHDRRARRARGEPVTSLSWRRVVSGRRSLLWVVPAALVLAVPVVGVAEKILGALKVLAPGTSLQYWGGDLGEFVPFAHFFGLGTGLGWYFALAAVLVLAAGALLRLPPGLRLSLGTVVAGGILVALYFRLRDNGAYFHFKMLAFVAPLALTCAVAGATRLRWAGTVAIAALAFAVSVGARKELEPVVTQVPATTIELREWDRDIPPDRSVRLDMEGGLQDWASYMLAGHPVCSQFPLLGTNYPHVATSDKADLVLVAAARPAPTDAVGPPLRENGEFRLYRLDPDLPGPDRCSRRLVQTVERLGTFDTDS